MNELDAYDLRQIFSLIDFLLFSVGISALIIGVFLVLYFQDRFDFFLRIKRGGDYCPLCNREKGSGGNQ